MLEWLFGKSNPTAAWQRNDAIPPVFDLDRETRSMDVNPYQSPREAGEAREAPAAEGSIPRLVPLLIILTILCLLALLLL